MMRAVTFRKGSQDWNLSSINNLSLDICLQQLETSTVSKIVNNAIRDKSLEQTCGIE